MISPNSTELILVAFLAALPLGWLAAKAISKERCTGCIRVNLYVLAAIEGMGLLESASLLFSSLVYSTGRYSDTGYYIATYFVAILFGIAYVALCVKLAAKKATPAADAVAVEAGHEEIKQNLAYRDQGALAAETLQEDCEPAKACWQDIADSKTEDKPEMLSAKLTEQKPKKKKQRYCKFCGGAIDPETKKCAKCGKQYFRIKFNKHVFLYTVLILVILLLAGVNVYQYIQCQNDIRELERTIKVQSGLMQNQKNLIEIKESRIDILEENISDLTWENTMMSWKIEFYDEYVVFVSNDGTVLYHKYGCSDFDRSYFWAYNTEAAKNRGYNPCPKCCE